MLIALGVLAVTSMLPSSFSQTCQTVYQLQADTGTLYALSGLYGFQGLPNGTRVTVTGILLSYNASEYINPSHNYGGTILVQVLQSTSTAFSYYSITVAQNQISAGYTTTAVLTQANNFPAQHQQVTITGNILYGYSSCQQLLSQEIDTPRLLGVLGLFGVLLLPIFMLRQRRH